jgi:hypothetical protein
LQQLQLPLPTFNATNVATELGIGNTAGPTVFRTAPITGGSVLPVPGPAASPNPVANAGQAGGNLTVVNGTSSNGTAIGPADTAAQGEMVVCSLNPQAFSASAKALCEPYRREAIYAKF